MKRPRNRPPASSHPPAVEAFDRLWRALFSAPERALSGDGASAEAPRVGAHLDGLLARLPPELRPAIAPLASAILRAPCALAREAGLALPAGEPWSLDLRGRAAWAPARTLFARGLGKPVPSVVAGLEDHPPEMVAQWVEDFGPQTAVVLAETLGAPAPVTLRVARAAGQASVRALVERELGVRASPTRFAPLGLELESFAPVSRLRRESGDLEIQDEGSQLLALFALEPQRYAGCFSERPGPPPALAESLELPRFAPITVIDACAGAGGKTLAIADALGNRGRLFAYDVSKRRLEELRRRARRAGLTNVKTLEIEDGREAEVAARFASSADVVLVDAPCGGWGVLRRNPDLKWRQDSGACARLERVQTRLLDAYAGLVAPRGRLVYATCTFRRGETTAVADHFLARHRDFVREGGGFLGPSPMDGFFAAAFRRVA